MQKDYTKKKTLVLYLEIKIKVLMFNIFGFLLLFLKCAKIQKLQKL